jgi:Ca2+:H+ antiporter
VVRRILVASLVLAPITIVAERVFHADDTVVFVLAAAALVPLAWLIGEATEQAAHHTGPGIGGFLNATFGNAPELIIALFAIRDGLTEVVRGSLTGSVVGNLLLVLGFSLFFGGDGNVDRSSSMVSLGLVAFATLLFLVPAVPSWTADSAAEVERHFLDLLTLPISIVLLVVYGVVTWFALRRHQHMHEAEVPDEEANVKWSLRLSLVILGLATLVTAFVAEAITGAIDTFAEKAHLSDFFVAAVIVAIVGNAAEHGGAVVVAARGKIALAAEIALSSSAQVAVFLILAVALLAWAIEPLALSFRPVELATMGLATLLVTVLLWRGRSSRARGGILMGAYVGAAVAFYISGERFPHAG